MSTPKKNKASPATPASNEINATSPAPTLPAKAVQEISIAPRDEPMLATTLRLENGFEYHLNLARSVVNGILDPDTPDVFIEVPCAVANMRRFAHTAFIKEIDVRGLE